VEDPDRNHASARLVRPVRHRLDRGDGVIVIKIDHGKDLAMPEMIGSYGIQPAGPIRWYRYSHFHSPVDKIIDAFRMCICTFNRVYAHVVSRLPFVKI